MHLRLRPSFLMALLAAAIAPPSAVFAQSAFLSAAEWSILRHEAGCSIPRTAARLLACEEAKIIAFR